MFFPKTQSRSHSYFWIYIFPFSEQFQPQYILQRSTTQLISITTVVVVVMSVHGALQWFLLWGADNKKFNEGKQQREERKEQARVNRKPIQPASFISIIRPGPD